MGYFHGCIGIVLYSYGDAQDALVFWESYLLYFILLCLKIELLGKNPPNFPIEGAIPRSNAVQLYYFQNEKWSNAVGA